MDTQTILYTARIEESVNARRATDLRVSVVENVSQSFSLQIHLLQIYQSFFKISLAPLYSTNFIEMCTLGGLGEYGCARAFHCEGGAICVDGRCVCPTGYSPTASNTKCAKRGGEL